MNRTLQAAIGVILATGATQLHAAGFYLKEQSIVSQGQAFAGVAAQSGIASAAYFNPAGLATVEESLVEVGLHVIEPNQKVTGSASATSITLPGPASYSLGNSNVNEQSPLATTIIPNLYWAKPIDDYVLGLSINAPFGSENKYDSDYFARYNHISASLKTIDYSLSLGKQLSDRVRVGGAIYYQTLDVEQTKGATGATQVAILKGDASDVGYSLGIQFEQENMTIGMSHRSGTKQDISGTTTIQGTGLSYAAGNYSSTATMKLPAITSVGIEYRLDEKTDLYAGTTHYDWSVYDSLTVVTPGLGTGTSTTVNNYKDTVSFSLGMNYQYDGNTELRGGVHYDPTPTVDAYRSHSTPDGDRTWLSFGASKKLDPDLIVDVAFSHIMVDDSNINLTVAGGTALQHNVTSTTETTHNILSIGIRKTF